MIIFNNAQKVMAALVEAVPNGLTPDQTAKAAGVQLDEARRWLDHLILDGMVISDVIGHRVDRTTIVRRRVYMPAESTTAVMRLMGAV